MVFRGVGGSRDLPRTCTGGPCPRPPESKRPFSAPRRTNRPDALFLSLNSNCMLSPFFSYYLTKILVLKYHLFCHPLVQLKRIYTRTLVPALCLYTLHLSLQVAITLLPWCLSFNTKGGDIDTLDFGVFSRERHIRWRTREVIGWTLTNSNHSSTYVLRILIS